MKNENKIKIIKPEQLEQHIMEQAQKTLRSPIRFENIDTVIEDKNKLGNNPYGFVAVPPQQDGFGNLECQYHIGRVPSPYELSLAVSSDFFKCSYKVNELGFYESEKEDLLDSGLRSLIASLYLKMTADIISLISSVYYNGLGAHIRPFYKGKDSVLDRVTEMINMVCRSEAIIAFDAIKTTITTTDKDVFVNNDIVQAMNQGKLRCTLMDTIVIAYHNFIIQIMNNLYREENPFDWKAYINHITSNQWGNCSKETPADEFFSFAYGTLCTIAKKDCAVIDDGMKYIVMDAYSYLSKELFSVAGKDIK